MSSSARNSAMSRHPALNRMPRDFISGWAPALIQSQFILKGETQ